MIVQLPYATAIPINILDIYAIRDEMYFHVLCEDNTVQILHYRILKSLASNLYHSYFRKRNYSFRVAWIYISNKLSCLSFIYKYNCSKLSFTHLYSYMLQMHPYKEYTTYNANHRLWSWMFGCLRGRVAQQPVPQLWSLPITVHWWYILLVTKSETWEQGYACTTFFMLWDNKFRALIHSLSFWR